MDDARRAIDTKKAAVCPIKRCCQRFSILDGSFRMVDIVQFLHK